MKNAASEFLVDLRTMASRTMHPEVFRFWSDLADGDSLLLISHHDPVDLYYQFATEHKGRFFWQYEQAGPEEWRVRLVKGNFPEPGFSPAGQVKHRCRSQVSLKPLSNFPEIMRSARRSGLIADLHLPLEGAR